MAHQISWPKIYFFGDSLTQYAFNTDGGWATLLADKFQRKADILARGFSGYNTRQCKALLPYLQKDFEDALIVGIFLGANDANDPSLNPQQSVPLNECIENLKDIVKMFKEMSAAKLIFMITPPAFDEDKWKAHCLMEGMPFAKSSALVANYAEKCVKTAMEIGLPCINLHSEMLSYKPEGNDEWKILLKDGLHLSAEGGSFVASVISPIIEEVLNNHKISSQEMIFPQWKLVSNEDPQKSFQKWIEDNVDNKNA